MERDGHCLKVLYVLSSFTLGGTETHLLRLIDGLKGKGYEAHVCLMYGRHDILHELQKRDVRCHFLRMKGVWDIRGIFELFWLIRKERFDIVHAYLFDPSIYAPIAARLAGAKAILTARRNYDDWMRWWHTAVQRFANLFTDLITVNSKSVKRLTIRQERERRERVVTIYNAIERERYATGRDPRELIRTHLGLTAEDVVITCVAKFKMSKGHGLLVETAERVVKTVPHAKFVLVGKGPLMEDVQRDVTMRGIEGNVLFHGQRAQADIPDILAASDICVLSSLREGFSNALLEYMAAGKALVVTDVGGNREIVKDGDNGILIPAGDAEAFTREVLDLINDGTKRARLGARARETAADREFEPEYMTERFNAVYRELLNVTTAREGLTLRIQKRFRAMTSRPTETARAQPVSSQEDRTGVTASAPAGNGTKKLNVIIISIDPLRQDHMSLYGYRRRTTPALDAFAKKSAVFTNAYSQAPWTTPSHMSLFTSLYPSFHGVDQPMNDTMRRLGDDKKTLAEYLKENGYATAAFTGSGSIAAQWGFSRGFDVYHETPSNEVEPKGYDIPVIYAKAVKWIAKQKARNFFLFFHTYNTHTPYNDRYFVRKEGLQRSRGSEYLQALYDGDIRETDKFIGDFLASLENEGLLERSLVIVLSDHGEDFGEHYPFTMTKGHGHSLYEELLRVPLVIYHPGFTGKGMRIDARVRLIDVMPTVLDALAIDGPGDMQGMSLIPFLKGTSAGLPEDFFAEAVCHGPERKMVSDGTYKYIYARTPEIQRTERKIYPVKMHELYNIREDPRERRNRFYIEKEIAGKMQERLAAFVGKSEARGDRGKRDEFTVDEQLKERLRSLGYID